ncbi:MAG: hypothetical protein V4658_00545 [Bacteroidota bacterium]
MKELLLKYVAVALTSSVKYIFGISAALIAGLNFVETLACTVIGGMLGVFVYLYLWEGIMLIYHKIRPPKPPQFKPIGKHRRRILKIILRYEVVGIAVLTPILLSVPIGTILAASIEKNKWRIKLYMLMSFTAYSIVVYFFSEMVYNWMGYIKDLF